MWSPALLFVVAQLYGLQVSATSHRDFLFQNLPKCWQSCFANTEDGCSSSSCICNTSEASGTYLPSAVSCAVDKCDANDWALKLVLGPLELLCDGLRCPIPQDVMDKAYAAASGSDVESSQTPTPTPKPTTSRKADHTTSKTVSEAPELTSIIRSTLTQTTTDSNGNTLQVIVPIAVGPSGIVTGSISTSTVSGQASSATTLVPSSALAAPSLPNLSLLPSSTSSSAPQRTASGGNGSPFDTPGAANKRTFSAPLAGLGAIAMLLL